MDPNAQPFMPQPMSSNTQPFIPQQPLNANAQPFVPQQQVPDEQPPDPEAPPFYPPYPYIPNGTPVDPFLLALVTGLPESENPYQIIGQWHIGFEIWAYQDGLNGGYVAHFNVQAFGGPMLHVYYNALGQLEAVGMGRTPQGY